MEVNDDYMYLTVFSFFAKAEILTSCGQASLSCTDNMTKQKYLKALDCVFLKIFTAIL